MKGLLLSVNEFLGKVKLIVREVGAKNTLEVVVWKTQPQHATLGVDLDPAPCCKIGIGAPVGIVLPLPSAGRPIQEKQ